jgi:hypothetical protein
MSAGAASSQGEEIWRPKGNPWIIAVAVSLAAFMLDAVSIINRY